MFCLHTEPLKFSVYFNLFVLATCQVLSSFRMGQRKSRMKKVVFEAGKNCCIHIL